jgi:hypothetical protein
MGDRTAALVFVVLKISEHVPSEQWLVTQSFNFVEPEVLCVCNPCDVCNVVHRCAIGVEHCLRSISGDDRG